MSVCGKHSKNKAVVPSSLSTHRQRVCDSCFPECQRGVTRRRRKTVGARTISLRYETDSSGTIITNSMRSQFTDYESIATTTTRTTRTTRSNPASIVYAPPPRPPNRKIISIKLQQQPLQQQQTPKSPHQPPLTYNYASSIENDEIEAGYQHRQQQEKRVQRQPWPRPSRRRASTSETKPKALQRYVDARSSSGSSSISSIDDHSASSESDSDSDSEELIAKYLRRGAPIKALNSSGGPSKSMGLHRTDTPPLEAIKEKHSLENPTQVDAITKTLLQAPPLPARKLQNRTLSSASTGTVSVTDSEEAEERRRNSDNASEYSAFSDCNEGSPVEEEDEEEVLLSEPSTPPLTPPLTPPSLPPRVVKAVTEPTTPPPRAFKFVKEPTTPPPRAFKAVQEPTTPPPRAYKAVKEPTTPPPRAFKVTSIAPVLPATPTVKKDELPVKPTLAAIPEKTQGDNTKLQPLKPAVYQITEQDRLVMREITALELEIQKYQSELPQLLETLQKTERTATRLREEAQESRLRVQKYRKAHCVVNRSIRNARVLMKEQEYQAAILELLRASGIDRSSAIVWFMLAECRLKVGQLQDAELACRKCIKLQQHSSDREGSGTSVSCASDSAAACVALLGKILQDQGRHDEAIECYLIALKR